MAVSDQKLATAVLSWGSVATAMLLYSRSHLRRLRSEAVAAFEHFEAASELRIVSLRECRWSEYRRVCPRGGCVAYRVTVVDTSGGKRDGYLMYGSLTPGDEWRTRVEWLASRDPEAF